MNIKKLIAREQPLYTRAGQQMIPSTLGANSAVISRSLCLYRCFLLQNIPLKERKNVLKLKVMQWVPYDDYGTYIVWHEALAQVWVWKKMSQHIGINYSVETAHYPVPEQDGMRILRCIEGFEAQYWKGSMLLNSHWWIIEPDADTWLKFQRTTGQQPIEKTAITSLSMELKAWKKGDTLDQQQSMPVEVWAWKAIVVIPVVMMVWIITEIVLLKQHLEKVETTTTQLSQQINPTLLARTETNQNQQKIKILAALFNKPTQMEYIDQFLQALSVKKELQISSWNFDNNNLEIVTQSDKLDPSWVVKKITEINWVDTVSISNTGRPEKIQITIKIKDFIE